MPELLDRLRFFSTTGQYKKLLQLVNRNPSALDQIEVCWLHLNALLKGGSVEEAQRLLAKLGLRTLTSYENLLWQRYQGELLLTLEQTDESMDLFESILNKEEMDETLEVEVLNLLASAQLHQGRLDSTQPILEKCLALAETTNNFVEQGLAYNNLGNVMYYKGQFSEAKDLYEEALRSFELVNNKLGIANASNNIGNIYAEEGEFFTALQCYERANRYWEGVGNPIDVAVGLNNIADIEIIQGELFGALEKLGTALEHIEGISDEMMAVTFTNRAMAYLGLGRTEQAINDFQEALVLWKKTQNPQYIAEGIFQVVRASVEVEGTSVEALLDEFPPPPYETVVIDSLWGLVQAVLARRDKDFSQVISLVEEVLEKQTFGIEYQVYCHQELVEANLNLWRRKPSEELFKSLKVRMNDWENLCRTARLTAGLMNVLLVRAKVELSQLDFRKAQALLHQVFLTSQETGLPLHQKLASKELELLKNWEILFGEGATAEEFKTIQLLEAQSYIRDISQTLVSFSDKKPSPSEL